MEILLILVVALVLFGPAKLPELGKSLGKGIREFKRGTQGLKEELEFSLKDDDAGQRGSAASQSAPYHPVSQPTQQHPAPQQTVISAQGGGVQGNGVQGSGVPAGAEASAFQPQPAPPQPVSAASMAVMPDPVPSENTVPSMNAAPSADTVPSANAEADVKEAPHRA